MLIAQHEETLMQPFIRGYAELAILLMELTKKNTPFMWEKKHTKALDHLIQKVMTPSMLACLDPEQQFSLEVDALS